MINEEGGSGCRCLYTLEWLIIVVLLSLLLGKIKTKDKIRLLVIIIFALIILLILYHKNDAVQNMFNYYILRYNKLGSDFARSSSSASQRILGNIKLFSKYNVFNNIFGVGVNQYALYFGLSSDYSNDIVCTLLNYGVIGIICLLLYSISLFKNIKKQGVIHVVIFLSVLCIDHIWFNEYFFYLLTWIILFWRKQQAFLHLKINTT